MAALTPKSSSPIRSSAGDFTRHIVQFSSVNNGDTYTAAFGSNCLEYYVISHAVPTTGGFGMNVSYDGTSVFTFYTNVGGQAATLMAFVRN